MSLRAANKRARVHLLRDLMKISVDDGRLLRSFASLFLKHAQSWRYLE